MACSLQTPWWSSCWMWVILKLLLNNLCQAWIILLQPVNVLQLPLAVGGACGGYRKCSGAEGLWPDGWGHPPHRLLQERGLRTWECSCWMKGFWKFCVLICNSCLAALVDALNWAVGGSRLHTLHQWGQFNPLISVDLQIHFYPCSTHSCHRLVPKQASWRINQFS